MLSNIFAQKTPYPISSLFNNKEKDEGVYEKSDVLILPKGNPVTKESMNSNKKIKFQNFFNDKKKVKGENNNPNSNLDQISINKGSSNNDKEFSSNQENISSTTLKSINNGIFSIFYIVFAFAFLIFIFLFEKYSIKNKDNYIEIGDSNIFVLDFFKLFNINQFIYHSFTFYISLFGFLIVYIVHLSVLSKNFILPFNLKFGKAYIYSIAFLGFLSNFTKLSSGIIAFSLNLINKNELLRKRFSTSLYEIIFYFEIYFTVIYGILLLYFLKHFSYYIENKNFTKQTTENNENRESLLENSNSMLNYDNINNIFDEHSRLNISPTRQINGCKSEIIDYKNNNEKLGSMWLKIKLITVIYLFLMLAVLIFLKISKNYFIFKNNFNTKISKKNFKGPSNISYNYQYSIAFLPYAVYIINSIFYFLNYGLLRDSLVKLCIKNTNIK